MLRFLKSSGYWQTGCSIACAVGKGDRAFISGPKVYTHSYYMGVGLGQLAIHVALYILTVCPSNLDDASYIATSVFSKR